ncbi:MAG: glycosyl hydrolase family 8, partial [Bacteroidota bacterium]
MLVASPTQAQKYPFPQNQAYDFGLSPDNSDHQDALDAYEVWKTNFLSSCGNGTYRVAWDDPSQTVSEGIAYGMLLTAYAGDRTEFDGLWAYYQAFPNANGLMNWKINGCSGVIGFNAATDAELDAAMALIVADAQWGSYRTDAEDLIGKIKQFEIESGTGVLKPGDMFGGSNITNPSYFSPAYYRAYGAFTNDQAFWDQVADKAYEIIDKNLTVNGAAGGLVSDWTHANGSHSSDASGYYKGGSRYHYDAARTPWRIALDYIWFGVASAADYSKKSSDFARVDLGGIQNVKDGYLQNGTAYGMWHNSTFTAPFVTAAMGGGNQPFLNAGYTDLVAINDDNSYFNHTIKTLALFMLTGNFWNPLDGNAGDTNAPPVISLSSPVQGSVFSVQESITLTASASDSDGSVAKVEFYQDGVKLGEETSAPYTFTLTGLSPGPYSFTAAATDDLGARTVSESVSIVVVEEVNEDNVAPEVMLTSPVQGSTFSVGEEVTLTATATDEDGTVINVEFFAESEKIGEDDTAPFSFNWSSAETGIRTLTARATDDQGATSVSDLVLVTIKEEVTDVIEECAAINLDASQWTVINNWSDQNSGSRTTNTDAALAVTHRQWGNDHLWVVSTSTVSIEGGKTYTVSLDVMDDGITSLNSIEIGLGSGINWDMPALVQNTQAVASGFSTSSFTNKSATFVARSSGEFYIGFKRGWSSQVQNEVSVLLDNIQVCNNDASANEISTFPNPFIDNTTLLVQSNDTMPYTVIVTDMQGKEIIRTAYFTNLPVRLELSKSGVYFVKIMMGDEVKVTRIIRR